MNAPDKNASRSRRNGARSVAPRTSLLSGVLAVVLAAGLASSTPAAFADELEDRQKALEAEASRVQQSLEFVDSRIAQTWSSGLPASAASERP